jgi:hypothetical protein
LLEIMPAGRGSDGLAESNMPSVELSSVDDESMDPKYGYELEDDTDEAVEAG